MSIWFTNTELNLITNAIKTEYESYESAYSDCKSDFARNYNILYREHLCKLLDKIGDGIQWTPK